MKSFMGLLLILGSIGGIMYLNESPKPPRKATKPPVAEAPMAEPSIRPKTQLIHDGPLLQSKPPRQSSRLSGPRRVSRPGESSSPFSNPLPPRRPR